MNEINLSECRACHSAVSFVTPLCPQCGNSEWGVRRVSNRGTLYTFTTSYIGGADATRPPPYSFGYVELSDGTLVYALSQPDAPAAHLKIGAAVQLSEHIHPDASGRYFLFRLAEAHDA